MIEWIFTFLVVYLLYKLIFDFIIPVSKVSSQMRNKVNQMHQQQAQQRQRPNSSSSYQNRDNSAATAKPLSDDYIDFEEVK